MLMKFYKLRKEMKIIVKFQHIYNIVMEFVHEQNLNPPSPAKYFFNLNTQLPSGDANSNIYNMALKH